MVKAVNFLPFGLVHILFQEATSLLEINAFAFPSKGIAP